MKMAIQRPSCQIRGKINPVPRPDVNFRLSVVPFLFHICEVTQHIRNLSGVHPVICLQPIRRSMHGQHMQPDVKPVHVTSMKNPEGRPGILGTKGVLE